MPKPPYIDYRKLALHLSTLPLSADCSDLLARLREYEGAERLADAVRERCQPGDEWIYGLQAVSAQLKRENKRFMPGLFEEWATEHL